MKNFKCWPKCNPRSLNYPEIPVFQILRSTAARLPFRIAIIFDSLEITYSELLALCERFANALAGLGVKKGDRVAIHLPNSPQFAVAYYATLMNGAIFTPCSPLMVEREMEYQLNDAGAETIITLDLFYPTVMKAVPKTKVKNVIVAAIPDIFPPLLTAIKPPLVKKEFAGTLDFTSLLKAHEPKAPEVTIEPKKDLAHLAYTGGTTGVSKGVMLTHFNVVANVLQVGYWSGGGDVSYKDGILDVVRMEGDRAEDHLIPFGKGKALVVVPWFHAMGTVGYLNNLILSGMTMVVFPRFDPGQYLQAIEKYEANTIGGAPQLFIPLVNHPDFKKYNLSSIRLVASGAAPLPVPVLNQMLQNFSGVVAEGYGLTEVSMASNLNPPYRDGVKAGSVGTAPPGYGNQNRGLGNGNPGLAPGEVGEVCIKGPQVMQGYWNKPEETKDISATAGYTPGTSAARTRKDIFTSWTARRTCSSTRDTTFTRGTWKSSWPSIRRCSSARWWGRRDLEAGEIPVAFVVLKQGTSATAEELMEYCGQNVSAYKKIRQIIFKPQLPVSGAGKILKTELRKELG